MRFLLYNLLLTAASPLLVAYLVYRLLVLGKSRQGMAQRLGWAPRLPAPPPGGRVWLHAVSAGEVVAAAAIARRLREAAPEAEFVVSTTTPAGRLQAEKLLPDAAAWFYFPFDFLPCVALALLRVRPTVVAAVETEIWPNWLFLARAAGARTALVNGQFADRGFRSARRARWLYRWALGQLDALRMQSRQAADRAAYLGAPAGRVRVSGNVKFEQQVPPLGEEAAARVRARLGVSGQWSVVSGQEQWSVVSGQRSGREGPSPTGHRSPTADHRPTPSGGPTTARNLLWIAGSTHPGEEEQVLDAFGRARERLPELRLLLAPRHIDRASQVQELARARGWSTALRSVLGDQAVDVLVLDTMGELAGLYALADVVFVGGSLVPVGGHDLLQPIFHGCPTLFGPYMHNQHDIAALSLGEGAAARVESARALADAVIRYSGDPAARREMREAGERLLRSNTGAARDCAELLASLALRSGRWSVVGGRKNDDDDQEARGYERSLTTDH